METDDAVFFDLHAQLGQAAGPAAVGGGLSAARECGHDGRREERPALSRPAPRCQRRAGLPSSRRRRQCWRWPPAGCGREAIRAQAPPPGHWPQVVPADPVAANSVTLRALSLVGTPYRYGGNTPASGFDCSGLINYVYRDMLDLRLPRSSMGAGGAAGSAPGPAEAGQRRPGVFRQRRRRQPCRDLRRRRPLRARAQHRRHGPPGPAGRPVLARDHYSGAKRVLL